MSEETVIVKIGQLSSYLMMQYQFMIETGIRSTMIVHGSPGIGKTVAVKETAKLLKEILETDFGCKILNAPHLSETDLIGFPFVDQTGEKPISRWARSEMIPIDGAGILFIDEANRANHLVQNSLFTLIDEYRVGEVHIPEGWMIVAAANRETDDIGIVQSSRAFNNRLVHIFVETDLQDVVDYANRNDWHPLYGGFLKRFPDLLNPAYDGDPKKQQAWKKEKAYPTPRTHEKLARWTSFIEKQNFSEEEKRQKLRTIARGLIGHGPSVEYCAYLEIGQQIPSIEEICRNPKGAKVPKEPSALYAVCSALVRAANIKNIDPLITYLMGLPDEFNVSTIRDLTGKDKDKLLQETKAFCLWAAKFDRLLSFS